MLRAALTLVLLGPCLAGCGNGDAQHIRLATTTSTANSGLLDYLLDSFTEDTGLSVRTQVTGTGRALAIGRSGEVDLLLVHARELEDAFLAAGHAAERRDVMYNDFVLLGPSADPAGIRGMADPSAALAKIAGAGSVFVSRGDGSGTHHRELALWRTSGRTPPTGGTYREVGGGMAQCVIHADEKRAYVLADRGTWLAVKRRHRPDLVVMVDGHVSLRNPYGLLLVNPGRHPGGNPSGARRLMAWLLSERGQSLIAAFRVDGQPLFHPNAGN